jgi:hypothetical protein
MIRLDKNALACDLAETYRVYDYRSLPARMVATFSVGLRDDSRIRRKINGEAVSKDLMIQAAIADRLGLICYYLTGKKEVAKPLFVEALLGIDPREQETKDVVAFVTPEEFEKAWKEGETGGN